MIISFRTKLLYATPLENGVFSIGVTEDQAAELKELLTIDIVPEATVPKATVPEKLDMYDVREYFYEKEGYMVSDDTCVKYWHRHKDIK